MLWSSPPLEAPQLTQPCFPYRQACTWCYSLILRLHQMSMSWPHVQCDFRICEVGPEYIAKAACCNTFNGIVLFAWAFYMLDAKSSCKNGLLLGKILRLWAILHCLLKAMGSRNLALCPPAKHNTLKSTNTRLDSLNVSQHPHAKGLHGEVIYWV